MYSSRKTTLHHGNHQFYLLTAMIVACAVLTALFGTDYLVIYLASGLLLGLLESALALTGARRSTVFVFGRRLPRVADSFMRSFVEGPGMCLPSFLAADQIIAGNYLTGILVPTLFMAGVALYSGLMDRICLDRLKPDESPIFSRRRMTRPGVVVGVAIIDLLSLRYMLNMPQPYETHAFYFLFAFFVLMQLFFLINYLLGVRMIERYDEQKQAFYRPGPGAQILGFTYDAFFEMALLNMPYYLIPFYLGLFGFATLAG